MTISKKEYEDLKHALRCYQENRKKFQEFIDDKTSKHYTIDQIVTLINDIIIKADRIYLELFVMCDTIKKESDANDGPGIL